MISRFSLILHSHWFKLAPTTFRGCVSVTVSELAGCTVAFLETHFWALDTHQILVNIWFAYLVISVTVFSVAVAVLGPLRRHRDKVIRTVAGRLFALAFCYIACNGCFGAFNIARFYLCVDFGAASWVHPTMTRMVCHKNRPNQDIPVPDWLITSHVT